MLARSLSSKASDSVLSCQVARQTSRNTSWTLPTGKGLILVAASRNSGPADTAAMEKAKTAPAPDAQPWQLPARASSDDVKGSHDQPPTPADLYAAARAQAKGVFSSFASTTRESFDNLRRTLDQPNDVAAEMAGRMTGRHQEGRHQPPHLHKHWWQTTGTSPGSSPPASSSAPRSTSTSAATGPPRL